MTGVWGEPETRFFFELTPDLVMRAVEAAGLRCTGRCTALNSFENRVYEVEIEIDGEPAGGAPGPRHEHEPPSISSAAYADRRVVKFYRPGRWSGEQILEEHEFLLDLRKAEVPVVYPLAFPDGETLRRQSVTDSDEGIYYALFQKVGGRAPDELSGEQLIRIGRLLGRIHNVGAGKGAERRVALDARTYGRDNLDALLAGEWIPPELRARYERAARGICDRSDALFGELPAAAIHRIHGDCHLGNLLWNAAGPFFLDFDDMVRGPAVQDLWLLAPGRDDEAVRARGALLEGYEEMRAFDRAWLRLIEPLRALRFIHYSAWIARRWRDPAFPRAFPQFGTHGYWADEISDLEEQLRLITNI